MSIVHRFRNQQHPTRRFRRQNARASLAAGLALALAALLTAQGVLAEGDSELFRANVPPNIMIIADNSGSMQNAVWHPDYGANKAQTQCQAFRNALGSAISSIQYNPSGEANRIRTR